MDSRCSFRAGGRLNQSPSARTSGWLACRARADQAGPLLGHALSNSSDEWVRLVLADKLLGNCVSRISNTGRWVGTRDLVLSVGKVLGPQRLGLGNASRIGSITYRVMDDAVVSEILKRPDLFPPEVVILADESALRRTASAVPLVSGVAIEDDWFDHPQAF